MQGTEKKSNSMRLVQCQTPEQQKNLKTFFEILASAKFKVFQQPIEITET